MYYHDIPSSGKLTVLICILFLLSGCSKEELSVPEYMVIIEPFFSDNQHESMLLHIPAALHFGENGYLYMLDRGYQHIIKFSSDGSPVDTIGNRGQGPGELSRADNLTLDRNNNIYVLDNGLHRVTIFHSNGELINAFSYDGPAASAITVTDDGDVLLYQPAADHSVITMYDGNGAVLRTTTIIDKHETTGVAGSPETASFVGTYLNRAFIEYKEPDIICILFISKPEYRRINLSDEYSIITELTGPAIDILRVRENATIERMRQQGERGIWIMNYFSDFASLPSGNFIIVPQGVPVLHEIDEDGKLQKVYRIRISDDSPYDDFSIDKITIRNGYELIASDSQNATLWRIKLE